MSRFDSINLAALPALPLNTDTNEAIRLARIGELADRMVANGFSYDVTSLRTDPLVIANAEAGGARELLALARRDDGIRSVLLATSWGPFLDALGANQVPPVARKVLTPATDTSAAILEKDRDYRARIQLAPEALSTAGPEGAYLFFALETEGVKMATCYGPMSFAGTRSTPFTPLGEIHVPIVAADGDGTASAELVAAVQAELAADTRRPLADFVTVSGAEILPYTLNARLVVGGGADRSLVQDQARARLQAQADRQHRPGAAVLAQQFYGAAYVADASGAIIVERVYLTTGDTAPFTDLNADPITPANPFPAYRAPFCTALTVTVEVGDD